MDRVSRTDWIIVALLVLGIFALAGFGVLDSHDDTCPDGSPHTGFSCGTGTNIDTPEELPQP